MEIDMKKRKYKLSCVEVQERGSKKIQILENFILSQFICSYCRFFLLYCSVNTHHCGSPKHIYFGSWDGNTRVTCWSLSISLPVFFFSSFGTQHTHKDPNRWRRRKRVAFHWFTIIDKFTAYYWKVTEIHFNILQLRWSFLLNIETDLWTQITLIVHSLHCKVYWYIDE